MGAKNRITEYLSRSLVDAPNELCDKEFNSQQLSRRPLDDDISVNIDTDNKVNKLTIVYKQTQ